MLLMIKLSNSFIQDNTGTKIGDDVVKVGNLVMK
jgi:hypothetical protein